MSTTADLIRRDLPKRGGPQLYPPRSRWHISEPREPSCRGARRRLVGLIEPGETPLAAARGWIAADELALICVTDRRIIAVPMRARADAQAWQLDQLRAVIGASVDWFDVLLMLPAAGDFAFVNVTAGDAHRLAETAAPFTASSRASNASSREWSGEWWKNPRLHLAVRCEGRLIAWSDRALPPANDVIVWTTSNGVRVLFGDRSEWIPWDEISNYAIVDSGAYVQGPANVRSTPSALAIDANDGRFVVAVSTAPAVLALQLSTPLRAFGHAGGPESGPTAAQPSDPARSLAPAAVASPRADTGSGSEIGFQESKWEQVGILAFVLGVLGVLTVGVGAPFAWFGIGFGIWALQRIEHSAEAVRGKALAWWGIGLSIAAILAFAGNAART